jgi:uncharacterized flavoprotein (TIGR03862 family)
LRAAEVAAAAGVRVVVFDGMRSVGRKFLIAGKGGLNLTHGGPLERFASRYAGAGQPGEFWPQALAEFGPSALREWAAGLGSETFQARNGRVYPVALKAAPLLRGWVRRLREMGVRFELNHRWTSLSAGSPQQLGFANGQRVEADAVVLALGGASWPQTGSDGAWTEILASHGIAVRPLAPANCGWEHAWPDAVLEAAEGKPLKNVHVRADGKLAIGELLVTRYGLEGGALYQLGPALRAMAEPAIVIDFKPDHSHARLVIKAESVRRNFLAEARIRWRLSEAAHAILGLQKWTGVDALAHEAKHCRIPLSGPRPIAEAISSSGGVAWAELGERLMLNKLPGVFVAGEMIDWEAPTGGYLLQGCFTTATRAASGACAWLAQPRQGESGNS